MSGADQISKLRCMIIPICLEAKHLPGNGATRKMCREALTSYYI